MISIINTTVSTNVFKDNLSYQPLSTCDNIKTASDLRMLLQYK